MLVFCQDKEKYNTIFTDEAIDFIADLVETFSPQVSAILNERKIIADNPGDLPNFIEETLSIRESDWKIAELPKDLQDRRVEITGPTNRKMIINALNSGANVFMADLEDSNSPTWDNVISGQINLMDAVRRTITYTSETGKEYQLNEKTAVLMVRPRGWHLVEKHFTINNNSIPGALLDFGLYFFHNAIELMARSTAPYFYLPKMESYKEAKLWNDIFIYAQNKLNIPIGTIKATCLIETLPAAFNMDEILWELKDHSAGLNCGRWDYIFSYIKKFAYYPHFILPNRSQLTMDKGFLNAYVQLLIQTCHKRGAPAIGGMAPQIPIKDNPTANKFAMDKVCADKLREVKAGHDGTWVAHPGLVPIARQIFDEHMKTSNQIDLQTDFVITQNDLLQVPEGDYTEGELRHNIRVGIQYLGAWLNGNGCVPLYNLMEDAATAEISRAQVWQWLRYEIMLGDVRLTQAKFLAVVEEEMQQIVGDFTIAKDLFVKLSVSPYFKDFLTLAAYELLN